MFGCIGEIVYTLISGSGLSALFPILIVVIVGTSIDVSLPDYYIIGPNRNKNVMREYLIQTKKEFLEWFNEIGHYFINVMRK